MKRNMKKTAALLLALVLCLALLPGSPASAAPPGFAEVVVDVTGKTWVDIYSDYYTLDRTATQISYDPQQEILVLTGSGTSGGIYIYHSDRTVVLRDLTVASQHQAVSANTNTTLYLEGINVLSGGNAMSTDWPAISVFQSAGNSLTIEGPGALSATGYGAAAGIGGSSNDKEGGSVTINGGTVTAVGGSGGGYAIGGAAGATGESRLTVNGGSLQMGDAGNPNGYGPLLSTTYFTATGGSVSVHGPTPPSVSSASPDSGPATGENQVIFSGANLEDVTAVRLGDSQVHSSFIIRDIMGMMLTINTPAGTTGVRDIWVFSPSKGTSVLTGGFTYTDIPVPVVTGGGTLPYGGSLTLRVTNTSGYNSPTYTWWKGIFGQVGTDSDTLTVTETGRYWVTVHDGGQYQTSAVETILYTPVDITATAGAGGSINPQGIYMAYPTFDPTFTIQADTGYKIADVLVDGVSVGAVSSYTFTRIVQPHTIEARFAKAGGSSGGSTYPVSYDTRGGSLVAGEWVKRGDTVTAPPAPKREWHRFTGWYTDKLCTKPYDFNSKVTGSLILYAGWAEEITVQVKPYIKGYPDGSFKPDGSLTRSEAAQLLYGAGAVKTGGAATAAGAGFPDVKPGAWYHEAVTALSGSGVLSGYPDGSFGPGGDITRAEFTAMTARFVGLTKSGGEPYPDVPKRHWASGDIAAAKDAGLVRGFPDGTFGPEKNITRAEAVTIINRMLDRDTGESLFAGIGMPFSDTAKTHWAYYEVLAAAVEHGAQGS